MLLLILVIIWVSMNFLIGGPGRCFWRTYSGLVIKYNNAFGEPTLHLLSRVLLLLVNLLCIGYQVSCCFWLKFACLYFSLGCYVT